MVKRMKTAIPGLDTILDGGFVYNNAIVLKGPPGSGKTTLGIQIVYNGVMEYKEPGIIVLFEQFPQQLFRDLSSYEMDVQKLIKEKKVAVIFARAEEVIGKDLVSESPLISRIHDAVVELGAKRILIDSLSHFINIVKPQMNERELLLRFINALKSIGLTPLMTAESAAHTGAIGFDEYLADCVLLLSSEASRDKTFPMRIVEIRKTRGHNHVRGKHPYRITRKGIEVFPHILPSRTLDKKTEEPRIEQVSSGISGLNSLLGGGYTRATSTIIAGMPGTFKTTVGVQFLTDGAEKNEPGLLVTFSENPGFLASVMKQKGLQLDNAVKEGTVKIWHLFPKDFYMDELLFMLKNELANGTLRRLVVDGINEMERSIEDPATYKDFMGIFLDLLNKYEITSLFIQKLEQLPGSAPLGAIKYASMFDGIIYLGTIEIESAVHKVISVLKMRGGHYSTDLREIACGSEGLYLLDKFVGLSGILAGNPQGQYKRTVEEIFQPLYFVRDFINIIAEGELQEEQRKEVTGNLKTEVQKVIESLQEYFDVE